LAPRHQPQNFVDPAPLPELHNTRKGAVPSSNPEKQQIRTPGAQHHRRDDLRDDQQMPVR